MNKYVDISLLTDDDASALLADASLVDYFNTCVRKMRTSSRNVPRVIVCPNWRPVPKHNLLSPPTGFVVGVEPSTTPIMADVFHPDRYGFGCTALQLTQKDMETCDALSHALGQSHFRPGVSGPSRETLEQFDATLAGSAELGHAMSLAGRGGVFCGIYLSRQRQTRHVYRVFLVAQGGCLKASNDLFSKLEDGDIDECGAAGAARWADMFGTHESPGAVAENAAFQARCEIIRQMAQAIGIGGSVNKRLDNGSGVIDTRTHVVEACKSSDGRSLLAYYSDMVHVSPKVPRLMVPETPALGLTLFDFEDARWKPSSTCLEAIPYGICRRDRNIVLRSGPEFAKFWKAAQLPPSTKQMDILCMALRQD